MTTVITLSYALIGYDLLLIVVGVGLAIIDSWLSRPDPRYKDTWLHRR